jgi:hypothetical protein
MLRIRNGACAQIDAGYPSTMTGYVYMTASQKGGTIYIGVTNDLGRRMPEHKSGEGSASPAATVFSGWSGTKNISTSLMPSSARNR